MNAGAAAQVDFLAGVPASAPPDSHEYARITEKRRQRAVAARLLLSLHKENQLDNPASWTWTQLNRLPAWCLFDSEQRQRLQLTCGALLLSAELRFWIRRDALDCLRTLLGERVFEGVVSEADLLAMPREPALKIIEEAGVNAQAVNQDLLSDTLSGAGAAVLSATVHESLPRDLLLQSLGKSIGSLHESMANALLMRADRILAQAQEAVDDSQASESGPGS